MIKALEKIIQQGDPGGSQTGVFEGIVRVLSF